MDVLHLQVRRARRRLVMEQYISIATWSLFVTLLVAVIGVAIPKIWVLAIDSQTWMWSWVGGSIGAGVLTAMIWTFCVRRSALEAAIEMAATIPEELLRIKSPPMADWLESFVGMKMHVFIRFGKWDAIIAEPLPLDQTLFCVTTTLLHYAKAVAHAVGFNVPAAEKHAQLFEEARARVPETRYLFNNTALDILAVASEMMWGEIEYRKMNFAKAFTHLRKSVELYDNMRYDEPWGWMQPTRHALGALLLEQKHVEEAASVYRADLGLDNSLNRSCQHPDNIWSLHGYHECLMKLGKTDEAIFIKQRLDMAVARADVPVKSSCLCRTH